MSCARGLAPATGCGLAAAGADVTSVSCASGMVGTLGAVEHCEVDADGLRARTVRVVGVNGLMMTFDLVSMLARSKPSDYDPDS
jgi:hypothetical protein